LLVRHFLVKGMTLTSLHGCVFDTLSNVLSKAFTNLFWNQGRLHHNQPKVEVPWYIVLPLA
jgi:hypothetical protein